VNESRQTASHVEVDPFGGDPERLAAVDLAGTAVDNGGLELVFDLAGTRASGLELFDDLQALVVCNLAEDDVLAIEPGGDHGGDEELRAVA
jgi:hypothetical protein